MKSLLVVEVLVGEDVGNSATTSPHGHGRRSGSCRSGPKNLIGSEGDGKLVVEELGVVDAMVPVFGCRR